jgi:hypothetical protein
MKLIAHVTHHSLTNVKTRTFGRFLANQGGITDTSSQLCKEFVNEERSAHHKCNSCKVVNGSIVADVNDNVSTRQ